MHQGGGLRGSQGEEGIQKSRKQAPPAGQALDTVVKNPDLAAGTTGPPGFERGCGRS